MRLEPGVAQIPIVVVQLIIDVCARHQLAVGKLPLVPCSRSCEAGGRVRGVDPREIRGGDVVSLRRGQEGFVFVPIILISCGWSTPRRSRDCKIVPQSDDARLERSGLGWRDKIELFEPEAGEAFERSERLDQLGGWVGGCEN